VLAGGRPSIAMSNGSDKPPSSSPFGPSPSAPPPSVPGRHAQVRVPAAGRAPHLPPSSTREPVPSLSPTVKPVEPVQRVRPPKPIEGLEPVEPVEPVKATPATPPPTRKQTLLPAALAVVTVLVSAVVTSVVLSKRGSTELAATASAEAPPPVPSAAPAAASTVAPEAPPSVTADLPPQPPPTQPFDRLAARAALDALAPTLVDCKIPSGRSGRIKVTFAPDGSVSSAKTLPPWADTPRGECVAAHLKEARVPPFAAGAPGYVYSFVIPR
jgi:hypothetical protein